MRLTRISLCLCLGPLLGAGLVACTQFPDLASSEGPEVEAAAYPRLLSVDELRVTPTSTTTVALQTSLLARVQSLRARAARLEGPVIDRATRARMARGVQ
ncbi:MULTISPECIES: hypothetical protein [unclassified Marinovum]